MSELFREDDGFVIDTDAKAGWALKKIAEARADRHQHGRPPEKAGE